MPLVIATWPNKSVTVVAIEEGYSLHDLFSDLDAVGNPYDVVSMFEVPMRYGVVIDTGTHEGDVFVTEVMDYRIKEITHMGFQWPTYAARVEAIKSMED
jgi:hypothetical protein